MTTKKSATKNTKVATDGPSTALASASINPAPTDVSVPPETWVEPDGLGNRGRRPKNGLPLVAPTLATELRKNASALSGELGPKAVDPQRLAAALDEANAWDKVEAKASTFHVYARSERNASWDAALALMAGMKLGVRFAVSRDASFADRFPGVAKAFAPTRRSKKKSDAVATASAPTKAAGKPAPVAAEPESPAVAAPSAETAASPDVAPTA